MPAASRDRPDGASTSTPCRHPVRRHRVPFDSGHALNGLSQLALWRLRLGIEIERIAPGHPQQNGRHERMHLTLKRDATKPAALNVLQQQARFDTFIAVYNRERPHQALHMKVPAEVYVGSPRAYRGLEELTCPFHDKTFTVTQSGAEIRSAGYAASR